MREGPYKRQMRQFSAKKTLMATTIVCASFAHSVCAQSLPTKISFTPEPVGSGARALGQSAFIAVADDATAASWNPAGLINLEKPEASFVGAWRNVTKDYSVAVSELSANQDRWDEAEINFMSYAHPMVIGNTDAVLSVNYHQVYDLGVEYNYSALNYPLLERVNGKSEGAISAYSLAGGLSIPDHPRITIGASFNWYTQSLLNDYAWQVVKRTTTTMFIPVPPFRIDEELEDIETFDDFRAHNFTFGLLWDVYEKRENLLTLGLVYHTPFTAEVDREVDHSGWPVERGDMDLDFPSSLGAGVNYRFSDSLSAAFDVEWKEWSKFAKKYPDGTQDLPVDDDALAYRFGGEHLFLEGARESVLACRGGAFYEPRPVPNDPDLLEVYGLSVGLGWTVKAQFSLDFAYQHRWAEQDLGNIDCDIKEHLFIGSVIIYF